MAKKTGRERARPRGIRRAIGKVWRSSLGKVGIVLVFCAVIFAVVGYWLPWTGFGGYANSSGEWQREKTLWDWMDLLLVPLMVAVGAALLSWRISRSEREAAERRAQADRNREEQRAETERALEIERSRDAALERYLDRMSELLLKEGLAVSEPASVVREVARAHTLNLVRQLEGARKGDVLRFLYESGLLGSEPIVSLTEARFEEAHLHEADLTGVSLQRVNLAGANLLHARLRGADLRSADLRGADLRGADLSESDLRGVVLQAADLRGAKLKRADLQGANLGGAKLQGANLEGATVTAKELRRAGSLEKSILPDGTVHQ